MSHPQTAWKIEGKLPSGQRQTVFRTESEQTARTIYAKLIRKRHAGCELRLFRDGELISECRALRSVR
jgi:hypothetical protein